MGKIFAYKDDNDKAVTLQRSLKRKRLNAVIREVTHLTDETLITEIEASAKKYEVNLLEKLLRFDELSCLTPRLKW